MEVVYGYFDTIRECVNEAWKDKAREHIRSGAQSRQKQAEAQLSRLMKEQDGLKKELLRVVTGESTFDRSLLQSMLDDNQKAVSDAENTIRQIKSEADKESRRIKLLDTRLKDVADWAVRFDFMSIDERRAVLNQLIERIDVTRDYHIKIKFAVSLEDFFGDGAANQETIKSLVS